MRDSYEDKSVFEPNRKNKSKIRWEDNKDRARGRKPKNKNHRDNTHEG